MACSLEISPIIIVSPRPARARETSARNAYLAFCEIIDLLTPGAPRRRTARDRAARPPVKFYAPTSKPLTGALAFWLWHDRRHRRLIGGFGRWLRRRDATFIGLGLSLRLGF